MRHPNQLHASDLVWPRIKILVFSLDETLRFMARSIFRKLNVKDVLSTGAPDDAEHLAGYAPDIALVDFDGDSHAALGFLTRLRSAPRNPNPEMPVLVLVKAADRGVVVPAYHVGIQGVVPKPVSGHELSLRVSEALKGATRLSVPVEPPTGADPAPKRVPMPARGLAPSAPLASPPEASMPSASTTPVKPLKPAAPPRPAVTAPPSPPRLAEIPARVAGGRVEAAAPAPKRPTGGTSTAESVAAAPAPVRYDIEVKGESEAARKRADARRAAWEEALAKGGHKRRKGADVAALDVGPIVAAHLSWLQTQGVDGSRANFQGLDLAGADISRTVLANATFREVDLSDAKLTESRLDGADFKYAKLSAADLSGANLGVAQLRHADMRLANLEGAALRGADLSGAKLKGARLAGADLKGATMISTDLSHADLSQVENLSQTQLDRAILDAKTRLPPGVTRLRKDD